MAVLATDNADVLVLNDNVLASGVLSASQTPSSIFPLSRLVDDRPSQRFIFPLAQQDNFIQCDLQRVPNGSFDVWDGTPSIPTGWTVTETGAGTVTEEVIVVVSGSSLELTSGGAAPTNNAEAEIDVVVSAGAKFELRANLQTSLAADPAPLEVYNRTTGMYLQNTGAWSRTRANVFEGVTTANLNTQSTLQITIEDFDTAKSDEVILRIRAHMDNATGSRVYRYDNVFLIPAIDFTSIHAQNLDQVIVPVVSHADVALSSAVPVDASAAADGNDSITKDDVLPAGLVDSRLGIVSMWFRFDGTPPGTDEYLMAGPGNHFRVRRLGASNVIQVLGQNSVGSNVLIMATATAVTDNLWHHFIAVWDLPNSNGEVFLDGVSDQAGGSTFVDDDVDFTSAADWNVFADRTQAFDVTGAIGELYFYGGQFVNIVDAKQLAKWRTTQGRAAWLGMDGSVPIGSPPHIYLRGDVSNFTTNSSGAGDFNSTTGTLLEDVNRFETLTVDDPTFYCKVETEVYSRFLRIRFIGQQSDQIEIGQWTAGLPDKLLRNPTEAQIEEIEVLPLEKSETRVSREKWTKLHSKQAQRTVRMVFSHKNVMQAKLAELVWRRTRFGADMSVVVPDTTKPDVMHCSVERNQIRTKRSSVNLLATELRFNENPQGITIE